jgi:hypothetical protein
MLRQYERQAPEPPAEDRLASLLAAAAAPTEPGPAPGESSALAAFRASVASPVPRRSRMPNPRTTPFRTAAAAAAGAGVLLTGGVAAATGSLPGAAQDTAREMLATVGVTVPGSDEHSDGDSDGRGASVEGPAHRPGDTTGSGEGDAGDADESGQGEAVSELAKTTDATGVEKGAAISDMASDGTSQAGEHGAAEARQRPAAKPSPAAEPDAPPERPSETDRSGGAQAGDGDGAGAGGDNAVVDTPNDGGTGTAGEASGEASLAGTDTADTASGGRSAAGSGNQH